MRPLPFLTEDLDPIGGVLRAAPEDFRVEEIPAYEPSGQGEHLYVTFEKRELTTPAAVGAIARALGVEAREAGWAGLKDRHAVTIQTASFARGDPARALELTLPGITVRTAVRHGNKLRSGHLRGNRFVIRVRGCHEGALERASAVRDEILATGVPNYYGEQRFGREGDNAARARAWLVDGGRAPREPFARKMLASALQSELFNAYLAARVRDGLLDRYVPNDLAVRHPGARAFRIEASEAEAEYVARRCSATGPMFGRAMPWPDGAAREREERTLREGGVTVEHFSRAGGLCEGTRRAVRVCLEGLSVRAEAGSGPGLGPDLVLEFVLPAGGYATAVLREFRKTDEQGLRDDEMLGTQAHPPDGSAGVGS